MKYVWVAGENENVACSRYRAFIPQRQCIANGVPASCWVGFEPDTWWTLDPPRTPWDDIPGATVIIQRIPLILRTRHYYRRVEKLAGRYGVDIDDLVFDHSLLPEGAVATPDICQGYVDAIEWSQFVTVSTPYLAEEVRERWPGKPVYVVPNMISYQNARLSNAAHITRSPKRITIGYTSGTATHNQDFDMVRPVLDDLLSRHRNVDLHLFGELYIDSEFEQKWYSQHRLVRWPHVPPQTLPLLVRGLFDINIVPLLDTRFNRCKSMVKFLEAGLFGVPSVVSHIGPYKLLPDQVVLKAETQDHWRECLDRLVVDHQERMKRSHAVRDYVLNNHTADQRLTLGGLV